jgi:hypothetical protein
LTAICDVSYCKSSKCHRVWLRCSVFRQPISLIIIYQRKYQDYAHEEQGYSQPLNELKIKVYTKPILFELLIWTTSIYGLIVFASLSRNLFTITLGFPIVKSFAIVS